MALRPHAPPAPVAIDPAVTFRANVAEVEHAIDQWISNKDRTQPLTVPLPARIVDGSAVPVLDAAGEAELVRRYNAEGWSAAVESGVLTLTPALTLAAPPAPAPNKPTTAPAVAS